MNAIKSLFAASIFIAASAANATIWEITATGSHYYSYARDLSVVYHGFWDDSANIGSWKGVGTIGLFGIDGRFSQNFTMNELTGNGTLQSMTSCIDSVGGAVCGGLAGVFVGPIRNSSNAFNQYAETRPSHTGTSFVPSNGGNYVWSFYVEDGDKRVIDPETGDVDRYWTKYDLNVTLNSVCITPEVPIPAAAWLFGSGLLGLASGIRRRTKSA